MTHATHRERLTNKITDQYRGYQLAAYKSGDGWQVDILEARRRTARLANVAAAMTEARRIVDAIATAMPGAAGGI
jgi:hypothetical protein